MSNFETFIGYPSNPNIGSVIESAVESIKSTNSASSIATWKALETAGSFIAQEVTEAIENCTYFIADVTKLNFNVTYEVGYAIAKGKPVMLTLNAALRNDIDLIAQLGIYDTIGYEKYASSEDFERLYKQKGTLKALKVRPKKDTRVPVYFVLGRYNIDQQTRIISRANLGKLHYRQFDPNEQSRLSAHEAIDNVASSFGVITYLLSESFTDFFHHNLRVAFICGLSHGLGIPTTIMQFDEGPVPLDFRDFVSQCFHPSQIDECIADFGIEVFGAITEGSDSRIERSYSLLENLYLGASSAENELRDLGEYYLKTDAFMRSERGDVRLVVGRKGSGKTAIFYQLRDRVRRDRSNVVLDLKPEGYQLLKFKDQVLSILKIGSQEHTITAFWEYLLLLEICQKLIEKDKLHHTRDHNLYEAYKRLSALYLMDEYILEGDFSERMSIVLEKIRNDFQAKYVSKGENLIDLSQAEITELIYKHDVNKLRDEVLDYMESKNSLWLLFDNVDKGWPAHGLKAEDLIIIRTLIEATRKIERDLHRRDIEAHTLVFLRNDVYELLIEETPDRGKESVANIDWHDQSAFKELIRKRILFNSIGNSNSTFEDLWAAICISHINGEEAFQYLADRCLMRPRFLIDLLNACKGNAVTLSHDRIEAEDISKGLEIFSDNILNEVGYELRDILPEAENLLYAFIGMNQLISYEELTTALEKSGIDITFHEKIFNLMLWYSFLGFVDSNQSFCFLYKYNYNFKKFKAHLDIERGKSNQLKFAINKAFWPALGISA